MQVIVHHGKPADGHGEDLGKLFDPIFNPRFSVKRPLVEQKRSADTARHTVIPAGDGGINLTHASDGQGWNSWVNRILYKRTQCSSRVSAVFLAVCLRSCRKKSL